MSSDAVDEPRDEAEQLAELTRRARANAAYLDERTQERLPTVDEALRGTPGPQFAVSLDPREDRTRAHMQSPEFSFGRVQARVALQNAAAGLRHAGWLFNALEKAEQLYGEAGRAGFLSVLETVRIPRDATTWGPRS